MAEELPKPMTQEEFDALPAGAQFINPKDGQTYIKSGGQEEDQPSVLESAMDTFTQASDVVEQGATFAISDEVGGAGAATGAALRSIFMDLSEGKAPDFERAAAAGGEAYDRRTGQVRENVEGFTQDNPVAATALQLLGGMGAVGGIQKGLSAMRGAAPTATRLAGRGAMEGAAYGDLYGAGAGEGLEGRIAGAAEGATLGALTGGTVGGVAGAVASRAGRKTIPEVDELRKKAGELYDIADQSGLVVSDKSFSRVVRDATELAQEAGIDKTIHPKATAALNRLQEEVGGPKTLQQLEILRRVIGGAAKSTDADERRVAGILQRRLDKYLESLTDTDVIAGTADAPKVLKDARALWRKVRKGEVIEDLIDRAGNQAGQFSGSGYENALRTQFRNLSNNKKKLRGFTKEEQAAIKKVARGGPLDNLMRMIGKFAARGVVGTVLAGGAGGAMGLAGAGAGGLLPGVIGAATVLGAGEIGRRAATQMTKGNVARAGELIRSGGNIPKGILGPKQQALAEMLVLGGAQQGPASGFFPVPPMQQQPIPALR